MTSSTVIIKKTNKSKILVKKRKKISKLDNEKKNKYFWWKCSGVLKRLQNPTKNLQVCYLT